MPSWIFFSIILNNELILQRGTINQPYSFYMLCFITLDCILCVLYTCLCIVRNSLFLGRAETPDESLTPFPSFTTQSTNPIPKIVIHPKKMRFMQRVASFLLS